MKKAIAILLLVLFAAVIVSGCAQKAKKEAAPAAQPPADTGAPDDVSDIAVNTAAEPEFEEVDVDLGDVV